MSNLELLLETIIGTVGGKKYIFTFYFHLNFQLSFFLYFRVVAEILNSMSLYASVVANKTEEGMYTVGDTIFLQKSIPTQFYTRKHKHGLWPLEVVQNQVSFLFLFNFFFNFLLILTISIFFFCRLKKNFLVLNFGNVFEKEIFYLLIYIHQMLLV